MSGLGRDLQVVFTGDGRIDLDLGPSGDLRITEGLDTLAQALRLRLIARRGELAHLGHRQYGSRVHELVGRSLDAANLQLLRRLVRQTLRADHRVAEILALRVEAVAGQLGVVQVDAEVRAVDGETVAVQERLDV